MLLMVSSAVGCVVAQEKESEEHKPKVRAAILMANSHVPYATNGGEEVVIIPTWGFDIDYFFHSRWSVALQGDLKLQSFEIEDDQAVVKRTNPFALALVLHYHPVRHWSFYAGPGYEFEGHKNLFLVKAGTEYSFEVTENLEIALNLIYENMEGVYDGWTFGVAFNKKLWEKSKK